MGQTGLSVMIGQLTGNADSVEAFKGALNKTIASLALEDNALHFTFDGGSKIKLFDDGQSCCEERYMTTDDDLSYYIGSQLLDAEIKEAPSVQDEDGEHEVQFLEIVTSRGAFVMETHNIHNGYYGGFLIRAEQEA